MKVNVDSIPILKQVERIKSAGTLELFSSKAVCIKERLTNV